MSSEVQELVIIKHKLSAIRTRLNRDLNALEAEIESRLPDESTVKRYSPSFREEMKKLIEEKKKKNGNGKTRQA